MRFILPAVALLLAADNDAGGGGATKPLSIDAQLTAAQGRVKELEALQTGWTAERTTLTTERDDARKEVTTLQNRVQTGTQEQTRQTTRITELEGLLTTANANVTTLTRERDDSRTAHANLLANPSVQALNIVAAAGGSPVEMRSGGKTEAADPGKGAGVAAGLTGLKAAAAKMAAASKKA